MSLSFELIVGSKTDIACLIEGLRLHIYAAREAYGGHAHRGESHVCSCAYTRTLAPRKWRDVGVSSLARTLVVWSLLIAHLIAFLHLNICLTQIFYPQATERIYPKFPKYCQRLTSTGRMFHGTRFEEDPEFDTRDHIQTTKLPGNAGKIELEALVSMSRVETMTSRAALIPGPLAL